MGLDFLHYVFCVTCFHCSCVGGLYRTSCCQLRHRWNDNLPERNKQFLVVRTPHFLRQICLDCLGLCRWSIYWQHRCLGTYRCDDRHRSSTPAHQRLLILPYRCEEARICGGRDVLWNGCSVWRSDRRHSIWVWSDAAEYLLAVYEHVAHIPNEYTGGRRVFFLHRSVVFRVKRLAAEHLRAEVWLDNDRDADFWIDHHLYSDWVSLWAHWLRLDNRKYIH